MQLGDEAVREQKVFNLVRLELFEGSLEALAVGEVHVKADLEL